MMAADPMQEDAAHSLLAAHPQEGATIGDGGQHEEYKDPILMDPAGDARDSPSHQQQQQNNKRPAAEQEEEQEGAAAKRRRKNTNNPPPKKLNNEQWDLMFDRLVEYKREHGVSYVRTICLEHHWCENFRYSLHPPYITTPGLSCSETLQCRPQARYVGGDAKNSVEKASSHTGRRRRSGDSQQSSQ